MIQAHAKIESCYSYIIFHGIVASHKEIQLSLPYEHRATFSKPFYRVGLLYGVPAKVSGAGGPCLM